MAAASFVRNGKKIVAIGRNYIDHVKELNNAIPKEPFFFLKPTTSYLLSGGNVEIPRGVVAHHEVELGLVIGKTGRDISQENAESYIAGYALAVDMTARNFQDEVKKKGLPWSTVKGFDTFTPVSSFIPKSEVADPHNLNLWLKASEAEWSNFRYDVPYPSFDRARIVHHDIGGPLVPGDQVVCGLADATTKQELVKLEFGVVARNAGYLYQPQ
ncbi:hypothetical protein EW146_g542 [Bondarzewia mesenterica]|uniref:Fumarylacetoacetase-like C-terminal domain-containing protein n=1 Tax=Bondarzewia mesenterica TaxID=1095465 RepID=A0A4S4M826_9AGAM|nr:hypothetical protein EW146_g542 [Bondarzewia mesenterica]